MASPGQYGFERDGQEQGLPQKRWAVRKAMACVAVFAAVSAMGAETSQATEQEKKMTAAESLRVAPGDSLEDAIARARTAPKPVTVELRGGMHFLEKPVVLGPEDSGLTLAAYPNEKPILSGGRRITGWRAEADQVWMAAAPDDFRELWVNGRRAPRARYPDKGYLSVAEVLDVPAGFEMDGGANTLSFQGRRPESVAVGGGRGDCRDESVG